MKKYMVRAAVFLGGSLPWAFFGMYGDAQWDTLALYGVMVLCLGGLWWLAAKEQCLNWAGWGAIASWGLSRLCVLRFAAEKWEWYFKPASADGMATAVSVAVMLALAVIQWIVRKRKTA